VLPFGRGGVIGACMFALAPFLGAHLSAVPPDQAGTRPPLSSIPAVPRSPAPNTIHRPRHGIGARDRTRRRKRRPCRSVVVQIPGEHGERAEHADQEHAEPIPGGSTLTGTRRRAQGETVGVKSAKTRRGCHRSGTDSHPIQDVHHRPSSFQRAWLPHDRTVPGPTGPGTATPLDLVVRPQVVGRAALQGPPAGRARPSGVPLVIIVDYGFHYL